MFEPPLRDAQRTYQIIGAALEVHRVLDAGFLELFYKDVSYLASSKMRTGLLLNFGGSKLDYKRFIWTPVATGNP
jgi:hypothetical protein